MVFLKANFDIFGRTISWNFRVIQQKKVLHYGIGNRCNDGHSYLLFLDYDQTPIEWIREELLYLQEHHFLGDCYLFKTKNGYHALSLEKYSLHFVISVMNETSCDKNYKDIPLYYGRRIWILRGSEKKGEKIEYVGRMKSMHTSGRERSQAHARYLSMYCGVPVKDLNDGQYDDNTDLTMAYYKIADQNN